MKWIILEALQVVIIIISLNIIHHIEKRRVKGHYNGSLKRSHDLTSRPEAAIIIIIIIIITNTTTTTIFSGLQLLWSLHESLLAMHLAPPTVCALHAIIFMEMFK